MIERDRQQEFNTMTVQTDSMTGQHKVANSTMVGKL